MPVSTQQKQEEQKLAMPRDDHEMWTREDFDQKRLRYEFAGVQDIAIDQDEIKTEDIEVLDPRTLEMPVGPSGAFDDLGFSGGLEEIVVDGQEWETWVYNHGFTWHPDMDDVESVGRQQRHAEEMFHYLGDLNFFLGIDADNDGTVEYPSMFQWIRSNIDSSRVFDCEDYDGDAEGSQSTDYSDVPEDLLRGEAMQACAEDFGGSVLDMNNGWDLMVGAPTAINQFQGFSVGATQSQQRGPTFWERLQDADTVQDAFNLPYKLQPDYIPRSARDELPDVMRYDLVDQNTAVNPTGQAEIGYDEVFLIPDMDVFMNEYVDLRESASPKHYGPNKQRGGERAHDYKWRYGHKWDPKGEYPDATDIVHLKNVSELFGKNN